MYFNFVQINDFSTHYFKAEYTQENIETIKSLWKRLKQSGISRFFKMFNIEAVNKENEKVILNA